MSATSGDAQTQPSAKSVHDINSESIEDGSNWFSFVFMTFLDSLFAKGYKRPLELSDLGGISKQDRSSVLHEKFEREYEMECRKPLLKRSLWGILWRTVGYWKLFLGIFLFCVSAALQYGPVMILTRLVKYFQGIIEYNEVQLWVLVSLLLVFPVIGSIALAHSNAVMAHLGAQIRNTLIGVIYRKSLKISPYRRQTVSTGRIITMFSDDTNQIRNFLFFLNNSVCAPLQIGACLYLIYQQVGVSTFVGLAYTFFTTPLTGVVFGIVFKIRQIKMKQTDLRVKLMNEILNGIRIIKYYAWENAFVQKIMNIRIGEVALVAKMGYIFNSIFGVFLLGATQIQTVLIFITFISLGNQLDAAKAFTTLTLFGLMTSPFIFLPFGLQQYNQSLISMKRIMEFLDAEDLDPYVETGEPVSEKDKDAIIVEFKDACLSWTPSEEKEAVASTESGANKAQGKGKGYEAVSNEHEKDIANPGTDKKSEDVAVPVAAEDFSNKAVHTLRNISLKVKRGQLVAIVGTVGSGKSSMLSAILGEMHKRSGHVILASKINKNAPNERAPLTVAYCDQRPWIVNATVKDNILFGKDFDQQKFDRSIYAACMQDDLKIITGGVMAEIGERGINLSGGQKARVSLARAIYNDADIYLLDDPLSAVDAHVGVHIFNECIKGALHGKTRFLVTHHLHVLSQCDVIVILDNDGTIRASGSYDEIMKSGIDVEQFLGKPEEASDAKDETDGKEDADAESEEKSGKSPASSPAVVASRKSSEADKLGNNKDGKSGEQSVEKSGGENSNKAGANGNLMTKEERNEGNVTWGTYWDYIRYGGVLSFFLTIFFQLSCQVLNIEANFWLADWGKETTIDNYVYRKDMSWHRNLYWFHGYCGMQMASIFCLFASRMSLNYHRTSACQELHERLLKTVMYLPVSFFDVTPIGRIINRFSQDMATIDEDLVTSMSQLIGMGGGVLGSLGAIAGSTKGTFLILAIPLGLLYSRFQSYFRKSNTAIARLEAVSRSPIYADFSQTLSGTSTIRAYHQQSRFIQTLEDFANRNTVPGVFQQIAGQWLAIRLDFLGALIMFFMGALTVSLQKSAFIPAGYLALGLSYSIQLTALLKMAVRVSATMEAQFNAVERVKFYIELDNVEGRDDNKSVASTDSSSVVSAKSNKDTSDKPKAIKDSTANAGDIEMSNTFQKVPNRDVDETDVEQGAANATNKKSKRNVVPPENWPQNGKIRFENVEMRYRDGPLVLKGVSFDVNAKDKIGIAGRTGCGKSSLMVALFQIENLANGHIYIDDIDISTVPLQHLRSKLCIIPQDPVMFSATVRFNLDPFDEFSDEQVWEVLRSVNMIEHVQSLPNKLQELVAEGGDNFSAGQRQLICIARAILRKPKVLVMDEATASIDSETDAFIQTMIRTRFAECTVLTIAHRLHTIIDSTKVLVMDKGLVGEFDSPEVLLNKPNGQFKGLWERHVSEGGVTAPSK